MHETAVSPDQNFGLTSVGFCAIPWIDLEMQTSTTDYRRLAEETRDTVIAYAEQEWPVNKTSVSAHVGWKKKKKVIEIEGYVGSWKQITDCLPVVFYCDTVSGP